MQGCEKEVPKITFGQFYAKLTRKQKYYLTVRSVIDRILAATALLLLTPLFWW